MMTDSRRLLADFAENGSHAAFRDLVKNYTDLVYSAAVRLVDGDMHLAQDVTQIVFIDLAKLARLIKTRVGFPRTLIKPPHSCPMSLKG